MSDNGKAKQKFLLKSEPPERIYCDSSFFISCILKGNKRRHEKCKKFIKSLVKKNTIVLFNTVVYYESYFAFVKNVLEREVGTARGFGNNPKMIEPYANAILEDYVKMLKLIKGLKRLEVNMNDEEIARVMQEYQLRFNLKTADAFHVATVVFSGVKDIVTFDIRDMVKIPGLTIWWLY